MARREPLIVRVPSAIMVMMRSKYEELTERQRQFLERADECTPPHERAVRFEWDGIGAKGAARRVASRLEGLGYVEYVSHGAIENDDVYDDREYPIYRITAKGRELLRVATESGGDE